MPSIAEDAGEDRDTLVQAHNMLAQSEIIPNTRSEMITPEEKKTFQGFALKT